MILFKLNICYNLLILIYFYSGDFMQSHMIFVPFIGWLIAVIIKFITNYIYYSTLDLKLSFSNGGFPSVHTPLLLLQQHILAFMIISILHYLS